MWAQKIAEKLFKTKKSLYNITCGISPSGPFHLGHLREILTPDVLAWTIKKQGKKVKVHFILDDFDHLRKLYPFLPKKFEKYVGKPLCLIPDPWGCHKNYSEHFFSPFKETMKDLKIEFKIYSAFELYKKGAFNPYIETILKRKDEIAKILKEVAGTKIKKDFYPFKPLCPRCNSLTKTKILKIDFEKKTLRIKCNECGFSGNISYLNGGGKLMWRLHWVAWWQIFNSDAEGFGKEHATQGSSYDTGKIIIERIFKKKAPLPIPYDLIYLKGTKGKMSSSLGNTIEASLLVNSLPEELVKYIVVRILPQKPIFFSPQDAIRFSEEIAADLKHLKRLSKEKIIILQYIFKTSDLKKEKFVPWNLFLYSSQISSSSPLKTQKILKKTGYDLPLPQIKKLLKKADLWLENFGKDLKLKINKTPPKLSLSRKEKNFLKTLSKKLNKRTLSEEGVQNLVFRLIKENDIEIKKGFKLLYKIILNKESGPKISTLISLVGAQKTSKLLKRAINDWLN